MVEELQVNKKCMYGHKHMNVSKKKHWCDRYVERDGKTTKCGQQLKDFF